MAVKDFLAQAKAAGQKERVDVPGMNGTQIFAVTLTRGDIRRITEACTLPDKKGPSGEDQYDDIKLTRMLIGACIVDGRGKRLIPEQREEEIEELPNGIQLALQAAALRVNGMGGQQGND